MSIIGIRPKISELLKNLPKTIQQELAICFTKHTLFISGEDDLYLLEIRNLFDSIGKYNSGQTSLENVQDTYYTLRQLVRYVDNDSGKSYTISPFLSKYMQKKIELIFELYKLCCYDELFQRNIVPNYFKPTQNTIVTIAFLSRFVKVLSFQRHDSDSEYTELCCVTRIQGHDLSLQEENWQVQQINNKLQTLLNSR